MLLAKLAVTEFGSTKVMVQEDMPAQAPPHAEKTSLVPGVSLNVTVVSCGKAAEQVVGQLIPDGLLVTVPVPETVTLRVTPTLKEAVTFSAEVIFNVHVPAPEQLPVQPEKK